MKKRGIFFSIDVLIGLSIILVTILLFLPNAPLNERQGFVEEDFLSVLSTLKVGELQTPLVQSMIDDGIITNTDLTLLEQLGELYVTDLDSAEALAEEIVQTLEVNRNIGIWFGQRLVASRNTTAIEDADRVHVKKRVLSGIQNGSSVKGLSARAFLEKDVQAEEFFFGGYVGDGNISAALTFNGTPLSVEMELVVNHEFKVYINDVDTLGVFSASPSLFEPIQHDLSAYTGLFNSGYNEIKLVSTNGSLYVAGGYIRVMYKTNQSYKNPRNHPLPGIEGLVNIYDGFYVPENLEEMNITLHYDSPARTFITIGNQTVYSGNTSGEETVFIGDGDLRSLLDYDHLEGKTVPLRIGIENASYVFTDLNADLDAVLVTDVSGSMELCTHIDETNFGRIQFTPNSNDAYCGERTYLQKECAPRKIDLAKDAEKKFVSAMLQNIGPEVGIVEYSAGDTVKKTGKDLSVSFFVGADPNCYETDWVKDSFDDSHWEETSLGYKEEIDDCEDCKVLYRNKFFVEDLRDIVWVQLSAGFIGGFTCFINENIVVNEHSGRSGTRVWNDVYDVPVTAFKEGENTIACSTTDRVYGFAFDLEINSDKGPLLPEKSPAKTYPSNPNQVVYLTFDSYREPFKDSSGNENNGINESFFIWRGDGTYKNPSSGDVGIEIPDHPTLRLDEDMTVAFWLLQMEADRERALIDKASGALGDFFITRTIGGGISYSHTGEAAWNAIDPGSIPMQEWHHVAITRDHTTKTLKSYLDGEHVKTTTYTRDLPNMAIAIEAGKALQKGRFDEFALYNAALTDEEISDLVSGTTLSRKWKRSIRKNCGSVSHVKNTNPRVGIETNFSLYATVKNNGERIAEPITVYFYKGSTVLRNRVASATLPSLGAYELATVKADWITTFPDDTITQMNVFVDPLNRLSETSENNNQDWIRVRPYYYVGDDLRLDSAGITRAPCDDQEEADFNYGYSFKNVGSTDITQGFNVTGYREDTGEVLFSRRHDGVDVAKTVTASGTFRATIPALTPLVFRLDSENEIDESDEENNERKHNSSKLKQDFYHSYGFTYPTHPVCSKGEQDVVFEIATRNYYCHSQNSSELSANAQPDRYGNYVPIPALDENSLHKENITVRVDVEEFETSVYVYTGVDKYSNSVDEQSETNNQAYTAFRAGPNIHFVSFFHPDWKQLSILPNETEKGVEQTYNMSVYAGINQCGPQTFRVGLYKDNVQPHNLLYSEEITVNDRLDRKHITFSWTATLTNDTTIYAVLDDLDEVEESHESNVAEFTIDVQDKVLSSLSPFTALPQLNPIRALQSFGTLVNSCSGSNYNLFTPEPHIVRTHSLSSVQEDLENFIDHTETWWETCICCGINEARNVLSDGNASRQFMVVMSDGEANVACPEQGSGNPKLDAIDAACEAYAEDEIRVFTVGFGEEADEQTLRDIAACGNGTYYFGSIDDLEEIYETVAQELIRTSYNEQTISLTGGDVHTVLYPDSRIEYSFSEEQAPFGLVLTMENLFDNASDGSFHIPDHAQVLDVKTTSYSGPKWTYQTKINDYRSYDLGVYNFPFIGLGDPYFINQPLDRITQENTVKTSIAIAPDNVSVGSRHNKIIYKVLKDLVSYSDISSFAEGCVWTIEFEDDTNITVPIPKEYSGSFDCLYTEERQVYDQNDAIQSATYELLSLMDFDHDGKLDVKITEQNLGLSASVITGIPYSWSTEVQIRTWE